MHPESSSEFDLAPPPSFGVAARTDGHLLPVATDMADIVDGRPTFDPSPPVSPGPSPTTATPTRSQEPPAGLPAASVAEPRTRTSLGLLAVLLLLLVGGGVVAWVSMGDDGESATAAVEEPSAPGAEAAVGPASPDRQGTLVEEEVARANDVTRMKAMSLPARHELLRTIESAGMTARVNLELHIALDLLQAEQASAPCETFSDALTLIERNREQAEFLPAIASVKSVPAPGPTEPQSNCDRLDERLAALRSAAPADTQAAVTADTSVTPTVEVAQPRKTPRKGRTRSRGRTPPPKPSGDSGSSDSPAPVAKPKPKPSVATKLDDLREID